MMKCAGCGKTIKDNYFVFVESIYCEECGLELLFYLDDDLSDIEVFKEETLTTEELEKEFLKKEKKIRWEKIK